MNAMMIAQTIPNRTHARFVSPRKSPEWTTLGDVLTATRDRERMLDPIDIVRSASQMHVRFGSHGAERLELSMMTPQGMGDPHHMTRRALSQLSARVLPSRGLSFLDSLIGLDLTGRATSDHDAAVRLREARRRMADMNWAMFAGTHRDGLLLRTVRDADTDRRVVRAALSDQYATYSNVEFVEDVIDAFGSCGDDVSQLPVLDYRIDDDAMRIRVACDPVKGAEYLATIARGGNDMGLSLPVPILEFHNSEVGARGVWCKSGTFTLWCSNGCGHWSDDVGIWRTPHRGRRERIKVGLKGAVIEQRTQAAGIVDAYNDALLTGIDDAYSWFEQAVGDGLAQHQIDDVHHAFANEATVQAHRGLLASVIDAVSYVAHEQIDMLEQHRMERVAGGLLHSGLAQRNAEHFII